MQATLAEAETRLDQAYAAHREAKKQAPKWRDEYLTELAKADAEKKGRPDLEESFYKQWLNAEKARKQGRRIKRMRGKKKSGIPDKLTVPFEGRRVELKEQKHIEEAVMREHEARFTLSHNTPSMQAPLLDELGLFGEGPAAEAIIQGTYTCLPGTDPYAKEYIEALGMPAAIRDLPPLPSYISQEEHSKTWGTQDARKASDGDGLSNAHYIAAAQDPVLAEVDAAIRSANYELPISPEDHHMITEFILYKKANSTDIDKTRCITLFNAAYYNINSKKLSRDVAQRAEEFHLFAKEQYGSRKHHQANHLLVNKRL